MNRRRITFVLPGRGLAGGIRVVVVYGNGLIDRGHDVTMICLQPPPAGWKGRVRQLFERVRTRSAPEPDHLDDFRGPVIECLPGQLSRHVPDGDAVVATHWITADPVAALPERMGEKFYFLQHYEAHTFNRQAVDNTWRLPMRKIVVARWLKNLAAEQFDDDSAVVIPNSVDTQQFDAPPRGLHQPPSVGVMYSHNPWKGVATAFEAVALARRKIPGLRLVCLGAHAADAALPLPDNTAFHHHPPQEKIAGIYAATDLWLLPSQTEGFGLPGLEAMACRCPVIATRCGGPEEFLEDGVNGFLVDVGDAQAMAERIVAVLSDESLHRRLAEAAYATRLKFTWAEATDRFASVLLDEGAAVEGR